AASAEAIVTTWVLPELGRRDLIDAILAAANDIKRVPKGRSNGGQFAGGRSSGVAAIKESTTQVRALTPDESLAVRLYKGGLSSQINSRAGGPSSDAPAIDAGITLSSTTTGAKAEFAREYAELAGAPISERNGFLVSDGPSALSRGEISAELVRRLDGATTTGTVTKPLTVYRGVGFRATGRVDDAGFASVTTNRDVAVRFAGKQGTVLTTTLQPGDTALIIGGKWEGELLLPRGASMQSESAITAFAQALLAAATKHYPAGTSKGGQFMPGHPAYGTRQQLTANLRQAGQFALAASAEAIVTTWAYPELGRRDLVSAILVAAAAAITAGAEGIRRVPKGNSKGGQFTSTGAGGTRSQLVAQLRDTGYTGPVSYPMTRLREIATAHMAARQDAAPLLPRPASPTGTYQPAQFAPGTSQGVRNTSVTAQIRAEFTPQPATVTTSSLTGLGRNQLLAKLREAGYTGPTSMNVSRLREVAEQHLSNRAAPTTTGPAVVTPVRGAYGAQPAHLTVATTTSSVLQSLNTAERGWAGELSTRFTTPSNRDMADIIGGLTNVPWSQYTQAERHAIVRTAVILRMESLNPGGSALYQAARVLDPNEARSGLGAGLYTARLANLLSAPLNRASVADEAGLNAVNPGGTTPGRVTSAAQGILKAAVSAGARPGGTYAMNEMIRNMADVGGNMAENGTAVIRAVAPKGANVGVLETSDRSTILRAAVMAAAIESSPSRSALNALASAMHYDVPGRSSMSAGDYRNALSRIAQRNTISGFAGPAERAARAQARAEYTARIAAEQTARDEVRRQIRAAAMEAGRPYDKARSAWDETDTMKFAVDTWEQNLPNGYRTSVERINGRGENATVDGVIYNAANMRVGRFTRDLKTGYAYHAFLQLDSSAQGSGFATQFNGHAEAQYKKVGITKIKVHANIDVGGYTWARQGFQIDERDKESLANSVSRRMARDGLTEEGRAQMVALIRAGDVVSAAAVPGAKVALLGTSWHGTKSL
ncbi:MAG TPA: hypothetical protein PLB92_12485, partial [Rhodoglobus sp.]|nr:hypothetical protein [Rhodoglobus sp.]